MTVCGLSKNSNINQFLVLSCTSFSNPNLTPSLWTADWLHKILKIDNGQYQGWANYGLLWGSVWPVKACSKLKKKQQIFIKVKVNWPETLFALNCLSWIMNVLVSIYHAVYILHYLRVNHMILIGVALCMSWLSGVALALKSLPTPGL